MRHLRITIPHPLDILIAKLHRFEEKDQEAFRKVIAATGFPTADDVLNELRASPRLFAKRDRSMEHMPRQFPESKIHESVPKLFWEVYQRRISVKKDILAPTNEAIATSYLDHETGHVSSLSEIAATHAAATEEKNRGSQ